MLVGMGAIGAEVAADGAGAWSWLDGGAECWFDASSHAAGAELITGVARLELAGPAPEFDLRGTGVRVRIPAGRSGPDPNLAREISRLAGLAALRPAPAATQRLGIGFESPEPSAVIGFWRLVCGYDAEGDDLVDPLRRDPVLRFARTRQHRPLRNRIHLDVNAGRAFTEDRIAHLERVGGRMLRAPISADADGNEACIPRHPPGTLGEDPATADWRQLSAAMVRYPTPSLSRAADLASAAAAIADKAGRALIIDVRPGPGPTPATVIIDSGKDQQEDENFDVDPAFRELARAVQAAARDLGLEADPGAPPRFLQVAIDAVDIPAVQRFWLAALGYRHDPRSFVTDIWDPRRLGPVIWFQPLQDGDEARLAQRNRISLRLAVPRPQVQVRLAAALAHGGVLVDDSEAYDGLRIADPEGNELELVAG